MDNMDSALNPVLCHEIEMSQLTNSGTLMSCESLPIALKINFYGIKKNKAPFFNTI